VRESANPSFGTLVAFVVRDGKLMVRHGPIPWFGRTLPVDRIIQIFVTITHGRRGVRISVDAATRDDSGERYHTLIGNMNSERDAAWLERQLERKLGIEDWPDYNTRSRI